MLTKINLIRFINKLIRVSLKVRTFVGHNILCHIEKTGAVNLEAKKGFGGKPVAYCFFKQSKSVEETDIMFY